GGGRRGVLLARGKRGGDGQGQQQDFGFHAHEGLRGKGPAPGSARQPLRGASADNSAGLDVEAGVRGHAGTRPGTKKARISASFWTMNDRNWRPKLDSNQRPPD